MSGWPSRIFKSMLGSTLRDARPVEDPELEWASRYIELLKHQAVGAAIVGYRVSLCAEWYSDTSSFIIYHQEEAWNPNGTLDHPVLERTALGIYTYTFAATYPDMDGTAVPFDPRGWATEKCYWNASLVGTLNIEARRSLTAETPTLVLDLSDQGGHADFPFWLRVL